MDIKVFETKLDRSLATKSIGIDEFGELLSKNRELNKNKRWAIRACLVNVNDLVDKFTGEILNHDYYIKGNYFSVPNSEFTLFFFDTEVHKLVDNWEEIKSATRQMFIDAGAYIIMQTNSGGLCPGFILRCKDLLDFEKPIKFNQEFEIPFSIMTCMEPQMDYKHTHILPNGDIIATATTQKEAGFNAVSAPQQRIIWDYEIVNEPIVIERRTEQSKSKHIKECKKYYKTKWAPGMFMKYRIYKEFLKEDKPVLPTDARELTDLDGMHKVLERIDTNSLYYDGYEDSLNKSVVNYVVNWCKLHNVRYINQEKDERFELFVKIFGQDVLNVKDIEKKLPGIMYKVVKNLMLAAGGRNCHKNHVTPVWKTTSEYKKLVQNVYNAKRNQHGIESPKYKEAERLLKAYIREHTEAQNVCVTGATTIVMEREETELSEEVKDLIDFLLQ